MADVKSRHGGKRAGAGRPKGSRMRRSDALADKLLAADKCPAEALVRLAEKAEADGDTLTAISAWKGVLPFVYAKPKAIEIEPEAVIALAKEVAVARSRALTPSGGQSYHALLRKYAEDVPV